MAPHKRFIAWQECHKLVLAVYQATKSFPKHELYGLTSQTRRSAFSAPANIVEGASRKGKNEFRHFLDIALGSLGELEYALEVAAARSEEHTSELQSRGHLVCRLLLEKKKKNKR